MKEICNEINFFDYFENYYKKVNTVTKTSWKIATNDNIFKSHPPLETIIIEHKGIINKSYSLQII